MDMVCHQERFLNHELSANLKQIGELGFLSDVTIACCDGVSLPAHAVALAASSPYLHQLLVDARDCGGDGDETRQVIHTECDSYLMRCFLDLIYAGTTVCCAAKVSSLVDLLTQLNSVCVSAAAVDAPNDWFAGLGESLLYQQHEDETAPCSELDRVRKLLPPSLSCEVHAPDELAPDATRNITDASAVVVGESDGGAVDAFPSLWDDSEDVKPLPAEVVECLSSERNDGGGGGVNRRRKRRELSAVGERPRTPSVGLSIVTGDAEGSDRSAVNAALGTASPRSRRLKQRLLTAEFEKKNGFPKRTEQSIGDDKRRSAKRKKRDRKRKLSKEKKTVDGRSTLELKTEVTADDERKNESVEHQRPPSGSGDHFSCSVCAKTFSRRGVLHEHQRTHVTDDRECTCQDCGSKFGNVNLLRRHRKKAHAAYECERCGRRYFAQDKLESHIQQYTRGGALRCKSREASSNERMHYKANRKCQLCSKTFDTKLTIREHVRSEHGLYPCAKCLVICESEQDLTEHGRTHDDENDSLRKKKDAIEKPFSCTICDKRFRLKRTLLTHEGIHQTDKADSTCPDCQGVFKNKNMMLIHRTKAHFQFSCPQCGKKFAQQETLDRHVWLNSTIENGQRVFVCQSLRGEPRKVNNDGNSRIRKVTTAAVAKAEVSTENGEAVSAIDQATAKSKRSGHFPCTICPKSYHSSWKLKLHLLRHRGQRPLEVCKVCGKQFWEAHVLQMHQMTHQGLAPKPFLCTDCGKSFVHKGALNRHQLHHSSVPTFVCDTCGNSYMTRESLKRHKARSHPMDDKDRALAARLQQQRKASQRQKQQQQQQTNNGAIIDSGVISSVEDPLQLHQDDKHVLQQLQQQPIVTTVPLQPELQQQQLAVTPSQLRLDHQQQQDILRNVVWLLN